MWSQDDPRHDKIKPVQPSEPQAPGNRKSTEGNETRMAQLGRSVCVKGEITGSEDLTVDGQVDGRIDLPDHVLTVGPNATICADVTAKGVMVFGTVLGTVTAHDRIEIRRSGSVEGNVIVRPSRRSGRCNPVRQDRNARANVALAQNRLPKAPRKCWLQSPDQIRDTR